MRKVITSKVSGFYDKRKKLVIYKIYRLKLHELRGGI